MPVSRRSLYRKFRDAMGRSLAAEIRLAHINQAKRLLATTDWPVSRIAEASGFLGATRFGIVFRRATGLTPTQYREERVVKSTGPQDAKPVAARSSTLEPAARKRPRPRPFTAEKGSCRAATKRATPASIRRSAHGPVRP